MRTSVRRLLGGLAIASVLILGPASAVADTIIVEVRSIAAGQKTTSFDGDLNDLKSKLRKVFADYTSFEQIERQMTAIEEGSTRSFELPEGSTLEIAFRGIDGDMIKLGLVLGDKLSTTLRASPGSTFFQAGLDYKDGMLVIAITVDRT